MVNPTFDALGGPSPSPEGGGGTAGRVREAETPCLGALDQLVAAYLADESATGLDAKVGSGAASSSGSGARDSSAASLRHSCARARELVESGNVLEAMDLAVSIDPAIEQDYWVNYRLKKQHFIELLRPSTEESERLAREYLRTTLAPYALEAHPDLYEDLRHTLLALVYRPDQDAEPSVRTLWETHTRSGVASVLERRLLAACGLHTPVLLNMLKYLLHLHKRYWKDYKRSSTYATTTAAKLLGVGRLPQLPCVDGMAARVFRQVDQQALVEACGIAEHEAMAALKMTHGDVTRAFMAELDRMTLHMPLLQNIVREYSEHRGLYASSTSSADDMAEPDLLALVRRYRAAREGNAMGDGADARVGADGCARVGEGHKEREGDTMGRSASQSPPHKVARHAPGEAHASAHGTQSSEAACGPALKLLTAMTLAMAQGRTQQCANALAQLDEGLLDKHPDLRFEFAEAEFNSLLRKDARRDALQLLRTSLTPLAEAMPALQARLRDACRRLVPSDALMSAAGGGADVSTGGADVIHDDDPADAGHVANDSDAARAGRAASVLRRVLAPALGLVQPRLVQLMTELLSAHKRWHGLQRRSDPFASALPVTLLLPRKDGDKRVRPPSRRGSVHCPTSLGMDLGEPMAVDDPLEGHSSEDGEPGRRPTRRLTRSSGSDSDGGEGGEGGGGGGGGRGAAGGRGTSDAVGDDSLPLEETVAGLMSMTSLPRHEVLDLLAAHGGNPDLVVSGVFGWN